MPQVRTRAETGALPRAVTILGELGSWVYEFHADENFYGMGYRAGSLLVCNKEGNAMWILRPIADGRPVPPDAYATHIDELQMYERFMHQKADKLFNAFVPKFRRPRLVGGLAVVRYMANKGIDDSGEAQWEHYFDGPDAPAPPDLYTLGRGQYFIAPGPWRVGPQGIHYARGG
jgi:hypothetical protein